MVKRCQPRRMRGATMVEFSLAVTLVLLPLCLLTLQLALLGVTRRVLDVAVVMSARAGAADQGRSAAMRMALAQALLPLYVTARNFDTDDYRSAGRAAAEEVERGESVALSVVAPLAVLPGGIANEGFDRRANARVGANQALLRRNLLTVDLRYCADMVVPVAAPILATLLRSANDDAFDARCLRAHRMPMQVRNTQVLQ